ncbi:MAG: hypothetical protein NT004_12670 [Bacteroidetes bacterium]|nr:hypothetical protein [Bacteroidota bacterium]
MKTKYFAILMLAVFGLLAVSCSKSSDNPPTPSPKYPELMGSWQGLTSEADTVIIEVNNTGATLNLKRYKYSIVYKTTGIYSRKSADIDNQTIPFATDNTFAYNNGLSVHDSITGNFNLASMALSGTISREFPDKPGSPIVRVTYTAVKK